jgi:RimJ/RimL family protein N-acetyltransferase
MFKEHIRPLIGKTVDLLPFSPEHAEATAKLRNAPNARAFFDQAEFSTKESQEAYFKLYAQRDDDLYWVIAEKTGEIVGATALYGLTPQTGEKGRLILDEAASKRGPFALEAELLLISFALDELKLPEITTVVRPDNSKMNSLNNRLGFRPVGPYELRGRMYVQFRLDPKDYAPENFAPLIDYWASRSATRAAQGH